MKKYKPYLGRVDLVKNQVEREKLAEQEAKRKRSARQQQQNAQRWLKYQEQLRSELAARYFHGVVSAGGDADSFLNTYSMAYDGIDDTTNSATTLDTFNGSSQISISYWIKPSGTVTTHRVLSNKYNGGANANQQFYAFIIKGSYVGFTLNNTGFYARARIDRITFDEWNHVLFTWNWNTGPDREIHIYVNGEDALYANNMSSVGASLLTAAQVFRIGRPIPSVAGTLSNIDEVAIWDQDVNTLASDIYNNGTPTDLSELSTAPRHWWRMGDGATWDGSKWTIPDEISGFDLSSTAMDEIDRETETPGS